MAVDTADVVGARPVAGHEELQDSAPLRDFARPADGHREPRVVDVPAQPPAHPALLSASSEQFVSAVVTAVARLLSVHSRRREVSLRVVLSDRRARTLDVDTDPQRSLASTCDALTSALAAPSPGMPLTDQPGVLVEFLDGPPGSAHDDSLGGDLSFRVWRTANGVAAAIGYDRHLYRDDSIAPLAHQLRHLLHHADPGSMRRLGSFALFDAAERRRLLHGLNDLRAAFPVHRTLGELVQEQAARTPRAICAAHGDLSLDFAQLDARSNRVAHLLRALGVGPGRFVAILDFRGLDFVVAMVAIWKAGGAYIPVDPSYPEDRVRYMLADSEATVAIAGQAAIGRLGGVLDATPSLADVVCPAAPDDRSPGAGRRWQLHGAAALATQPAAALPAIATPTDPAYMIYTSGSTGRPKGAIVRHDGAVNHLFAQAHALGAESVARFLQSAPSSSDISVWQFAAPLVLGGTTVIVDDATDVENLHRQVRRHGLHILELVPAVLKYLVEFARSLPAAERGLPSLRWAMVTGESASVELVNAWLSVYPGIPVVNAYGPTEAADDITQAIIRAPLPANQVTVPIGRPLANVDIYLLDERLEPVPIGAPGEICVAGIGVGDGYWKQPDKTAAAFVPNPFPGAAGPTIYRTGDLGRLRDDGSIECLGRLDHQVQLRGFRIELQEIEAVLTGHPAIRDAVVKAFHDGHGDGELVAFLVGRDGQGAAADDASLRTMLGARLPPYMVPARFVRMPALPLNPAGKVDRKALVPPAAAQPGRKLDTPFREPEDDVERALATVWAQELGVEAVGRDDDFFALGGDSLAALAIAVGAREAGWHLKSADVLGHPTVARLAAIARPVAAAVVTTAAAVRQPALPPLESALREAFLADHPQYEDVQPLTPSQQGIFLHGLLTRDKTAYIDQYVYEIDGDLDTEAFAAAWRRLVSRHAALRTAFVRKRVPRPVQAVLRAPELPLQVLDHRNLADPAREAAFAQLLRDELARGFDLASPPLMRLVLVRSGEQAYRLVWTHHHLVLDGWSLSLALDEVLQAHDRLRAGTAEEDQREPVVPFARVIDALAATDLAEEERYWQGLLQGYPGAPKLDLAPAADGRGFAHAECTLDAGLTHAIDSRARRAGTTPTTVLQLAWAAVLARLGGSEDVVFGVVTSGRELPVPGIDAVLGLLVATLPLRVPASAAAGAELDDRLRQVQALAAGLREHESAPLSLITRAAGLPPGRTLFETLFVMSNFPEPAAKTRLRLRPGPFRTVPAFPLTLIVVPGDRLLLRLVYDRARCAPAQADAVLRQLSEVLEAAARRDELPASDERRVPAAA